MLGKTRLKAANIVRRRVHGFRKKLLLPIVIEVMVDIAEVSEALTVITVDVVGYSVVAVYVELSSCAVIVVRHTTKIIAVIIVVDPVNMTSEIQRASGASFGDFLSVNYFDFVRIITKCAFTPIYKY